MRLVLLIPLLAIRFVLYYDNMSTNIFLYLQDEFSELVNDDYVAGDDDDMPEVKLQTQATCGPALVLFLMACQYMFKSLFEFS